MVGTHRQHYYLLCLQYNQTKPCRTNIFLSVHSRQQQALPRDSAMEDMNLRNHYLEDRLHSLESQKSSVRLHTD